MLPEGWDRIRLSEGVSKIGSGVTPRGGEEAYKSEGFPLVRSQNVGWGRLLLGNVCFIDSEQHNAMAGTKLKSGDVLLNITGASIGRVASYYGDDFGANVNQHVCIIRSDGSLEPRFIEAFLLSEFGQKQVDQFQAGGNRQGLNFEQVGSFRLPRPPLPEQRKIAEILSTWDQAIAAQERLIANARAQKKALMQTLLTGNRRLPGFSGEWRSVCLGDIGKLRKGKGIQRDQVRASGFPCIRYGEIYTQHHEQVRQFHSFIDAETAAESEPISAGDILFTCSGETAEEIGKCVAYLGNDKAYAGGDIIILSPTTANAAFLGYVLNDTAVTEQKRRFGQGNSVVHISAANLAKLTFKPPDRAEQDAIASILDVATDHIGGLEAALTTLAQEKSALMQQLLTGKRRVRVEELTA